MTRSDPNATRKRDLDAFAAALTAAMKSKGVTQTALAVEVDVTQSMVSTWVNAVYAPNPYVLVEVEATLDLNPGDLTRHLGYLPLTFDQGAVSSVRDAIAADRSLDATGKGAVLALYAHFAQPAPPKTAPRKSPGKKARKPPAK